MNTTTYRGQIDTKQHHACGTRYTISQANCSVYHLSEKANSQHNVKNIWNVNHKIFRFRKTDD